MTRKFIPERLKPFAERLLSILPPETAKQVVPPFIQVDESMVPVAAAPINLAELLSVPLTSLTVKVEDQPPPSP